MCHEFQQKGIHSSSYSGNNTGQKMKFSIKDFSSKCDHIRRKLRIWSYLLKKSLMGNFIFCAVQGKNFEMCQMDRFTTLLLHYIYSYCVQSTYTGNCICVCIHEYIRIKTYICSALFSAMQRTKSIPLFTKRLF